MKAQEKDTVFNIVFDDAFTFGLHLCKVYFSHLVYILQNDIFLSRNRKVFVHEGQVTNWQKFYECTERWRFVVVVRLLCRNLVTCWVKAGSRITRRGRERDLEIVKEDSAWERASIPRPTRSIGKHQINSRDSNSKDAVICFSSSRHQRS